MKIYLPTLLLLPALLLGCSGSSDTPEASVPLNTEFYGLWTIDELAYVAVSKKSITVFAYDDERSCFEASLYSVSHSTETSLTSLDVQTGEESTSKFSLNEEALLIEEDGRALTFMPASYLNNPFPGCDNAYGINAVEIALELAYLPPTITIDRDAQENGRVEYSYRVSFDLNKNDVIDAGDVGIELKHYKGRGDYPSNYELAVSDLGADIWVYLPENQADQIASTTSSHVNNRLQFSQNDGVLTVSFDANQHPLLAHINQDTPVVVNTYLSYPEPETQVIDNWQDGPWAWSSVKHRDQLPDEGFTKPNLHSNNTIDDATSDLIEGESSWVDIKSVVFKFL